MTLPQGHVWMLTAGCGWVGGEAWGCPAWFKATFVLLQPGLRASWARSHRPPAAP